MKMQLSGQMKLEQRLKLAPKMIQSMEILQLPMIALEQRIETELNSNPVLEVSEPGVDSPETPAQEKETDYSQQELVVSQDKDKEDDFARMSEIDYDYQDYWDRNSYKPAKNSGQPDKKLEAMNNTAAPDVSLHDHLLDQWRLVDADEKVKAAGEMIIDFIDEKGYLSVRIEQLHNKDKNPFGIDHLYKALELVQTLEPAGVGARDIKDCLLIQLEQQAEDYGFEIDLVKGYMNELLENKLPDIARKMGKSVEEINKAIKRLSRFDTSPGLQVGRYENFPVNADVIVEADEDGNYAVRLADDNLPALQISPMYTEMASGKNVDDSTKQFLQQNMRSARWLIEAIQQRRSTLLKVSDSIIKHQREFLDKGQLHLKPLPMATVADEIGVHVATVSRAVAGKYMQCPQGLVPLRSMFSGGTDNSDGQSHSWDAIRAKMQEIIDDEDKSKPLNDDQIREMLEKAGLGSIARRTVAKYRKIMNIPSCRLRKRF